MIVPKRTAWQAKTCPRCARGRGESELAEARLVSGGVTFAEQFGLLDPVVTPDTALEPAQLVVDPVDIGFGPCRDLREGRHAEFVQLEGELGAYTLELGQVVAIDRAGRGRSAFLGRRRADSCACAAEAVGRSKSSSAAALN